MLQLDATTCTFRGHVPGQTAVLPQCTSRHVQDSLLFSNIKDAFTGPVCTSAFHRHAGHSLFPHQGTVWPMHIRYAVLLNQSFCVFQGLEDAIGLSVTHPTWQRTKPDDPSDEHTGWTFASPEDPPFSSPTGTCYTPLCFRGYKAANRHKSCVGSPGTVCCALPCVKEAVPDVQQY